MSQLEKIRSGKDRTTIIDRRNELSFLRRRSLFYSVSVFGGGLGSIGSNRALRPVTTPPGGKL